jgi:prepilin-type N-terminal cleavage/methylation domain-containing protein
MDGTMTTRTLTSSPVTDAGFSLVEVLVALALLSFIGLGSVALMSVVIRQDKLAGRRGEATSLAVERLENIEALPFQDSASYTAYALPGETAAAGPPRTLTAAFGAVPGFPSFQRVVTLEYNVPVAGMLKAKVDVTWRDLQQGVKTHTLVTYLHPSLDSH